MTDEILRPSAEWAAEAGITILDPDGWRGADGRPFADPISHDEFLRRMTISTIGPASFHEPAVTDDAEVVAVPRVLLAGLFDLATNSMDFGSGFWDADDTGIARAVALLLGVDPSEATPRNVLALYPHPFRPYPQSTRDECMGCYKPKSWTCHDAEGGEAHLTTAQP